MSLAGPAVLRAAEPKTMMRKGWARSTTAATRASRASCCVVTCTSSPSAAGRRNRVGKPILPGTGAWVKAGWQTQPIETHSVTGRAPPPSEQVETSHRRVAHGRLRHSAYVVAAGGDGQVVVWDTRRWEIVRILDKFRLMGQALAVTPDGRHVATGSEVGRAIWNLDNGRAARTWSSNGPIDRGHLQALRSMRAGPRSPCPTEVRDRCQSIRESTGFACQ